MTVQPSVANLSSLAYELLEVIWGELEHDRWAILNVGTDSTKVRAYEMASLRHCSQILSEMIAAANQDLHLTVTILARVHIEASFVGMFITVGGMHALHVIAANTRYEDETTANELDAWNARLRDATRAIRKRIRRLTKVNAQMASWNEKHPGEPPKSLLVPPRLPRQNYVDGVADELRKRVNTDPAKTSLRKIVDETSRLAKALGLTHEPLDPIYHVYRLVSSQGTHASLGLLDSYLQVDPGSTFIRVGESSIQWDTKQHLINAIYSLALLAEWLFQSRGGDFGPVRKIRLSLEPQSSDLRGWTPDV